MNKKKIIILISSFILSIILAIILNLNQNKKLYISEVLASNDNVIKDNYGNYSDYIELHNSSNTDISLNDYHLSDSEYDTNKWTFPDIKIKSKEYLIIYASGLNECISNICHTNFKLSSKGEVVTLSDNLGNIISKITYPYLDKNISYGYKNNRYMLLKTPTPGAKNSSEEIVIKTNDTSSITINEYMTHNTRFHYDKYGNYYDWVELYNSSDKKISIENLYITDDKSNLKKYKLPLLEIEKNGYLILYFSKDSKNYEENNYVPFNLSDSDKYIIISNGEKIIDKVEIVHLEDNISYGKIDNEFKYFTTPTPGAKNDTTYFDSLGGTDGNT